MSQTMSQTLPNPQNKTVSQLVNSAPLGWAAGETFVKATRETVRSLSAVIADDTISLDSLMRAHRALELVFEREGARRGVTFGLSAPTRLYVDAFTQEWQEAGQIVAREIVFKQYHRETIGKGPSFSDVRDLFQDLKLKSATPDETLRRLLVFLKDAEIKENDLRSEEAKKKGEESRSTAFWPLGPPGLGRDLQALQQNVNAIIERRLNQIANREGRRPLVATLDGFADGWEWANSYDDLRELCLHFWEKLGGTEGDFIKRVVPHLRSLNTVNLNEKKKNEQLSPILEALREEENSCLKAQEADPKGLKGRRTVIWASYRDDARLMKLAGVGASRDDDLD